MRMTEEKSKNMRVVANATQADGAPCCERKRSVEEIVRFVSAYLDTMPITGVQDARDAKVAFAQLIERWKDADLNPKKDQPALMEAATVIAASYDLAVGNLLTYIAEQLQEEKPPEMRVATAGVRILESAYDVFAEKGFYHATVDEIAEKAGVGKGTVYRHFDSKDNLFRAVVQEKLDDLVGSVREGFRHDDDVLKGIRRAVGNYLRFFETHKRFYRILIFEQQGFGTEFRTAYIDGIVANVPVIRELVVEASEGGRLKPLDDFYTVFYGLVGFVDGVIHKWFRNGCESSLEDELDTIIEVVFYGFVRNGSLMSGPASKTY